MKGLQYEFAKWLTINEHSGSREPTPDSTKVPNINRIRHLRAIFVKTPMGDFTANVREIALSRERTKGGAAGPD